MPQNRFGGRKATGLKYLLLTSTALVGLGQPIAATAAETWTGAVSTDWFAAGNWNPGSLPTAADNVTINTVVINPTVINAGNAFAAGLTIADGFSSTGNLTISNAGTLTSQDGTLAYSATANASATVTGAGSSWSTFANLIVGYGGTGTLNVASGGVVNDLNSYVGYVSGSSGTATVDGAGSQWSSTGNLYVGLGGTGSVTVSNGGLLSDDLANIGGGFSASGTVVVTGAGSTWTNSSQVTVGDQGTGFLDIFAGAKVTDVTGLVAANAGSHGTVNVSGTGSTWTNSGDLTLGLSGTGAMFVSAGGKVTDSLGTIAKNSASTGTVTVDGAGSAWTNSSHLFVGDQGAGALNISNGGKVSNLSGIVGNLAGSTGIVTVDGASSTWANAALAVGNAGFGALTITNGGKVTSSVGYAAYDVGSAGTVIVDGAGSSWTNSSDLFVGDRGNGTLAVSNGGAVKNALGYVGDNAGSTGFVFVDGAGSTWTNADLFVGNAGTGTVAISHGGTVSSGTGVIGSQAGSTGTVIVDNAGSTWTNSADLFVGDYGTGTLAISHGAVSNGSAIIGAKAGSTGMAFVDGVGATWTNSSNLYVGADGAGTLAISNGGTVTSNAGYLAFDAGSMGTAMVAGAGSSWNSSSLLFVGQRGWGSLIVSNGGNVANTDGYLGGNAGSVGLANVSGPGSTWTSSGNLNIGIGGTGTLTIANGGAVSAGGAVDIAVLAGSVGTLNIGAASGSPAAAAGSLNAASIQFGAGAGAINFNHTDTNYAFASAIGGVGIINQIAGTTNLTADSSGFTGATNVSGGLLAVNGSLANSLVTISGGTLGGNGTVGGIVAQSGGIIAPGNSIGTLNVAGDVDQAAGSVYQAELTSTGQSDLIHATGTATIAVGAVLEVVKTDAAPYVVGTHYTVLQADGGVAGNYTLTGDIGTAFLGLADSYDANHVYLDVIQKTFAQVGLTPNQIATGGGAESLGAGNPLYDAIVVLPTAAAAQDAFDQLSGEIHASAKGMLLEDSRFVRDAATNRIAAAFGDAGAAPLPVMAYGEGGPEMAAADTDRFAVWGQAFGAWGNTDSDGNAAAFDRSTGGLLVGADRLVGDWRVGLIGGYSHSSFHADARNSSGSSDNYHLGLYGGTNWGAIAFRTGAAYSWNGISTKRSVAFNGFADQLSADHDAGTAQVFGELAYKMDANRFHFEPFADLAYVSVHTDGFTEQGGAAALASAGSTTNATFTTLGLRASTDVALGGMSATARGMLGWRHAFGDVTPTSTFALAGGDAFTIAGVPVARDSAVIEAGFDLQMSANATLGLSYVGQFGGHSTDNGAKANLNVRF
ncbi:autotransporter outer membrane beta-barrel domain-containing protein [Mesorhizobium sp. VK9D]|uniref:autotransporter outer membrane beta-barrel domain-containing protein n=1 Tax=Mesorhizobium australafricanum TaxID=3072311 RepID=UPI002A2471E4|nr:autotransporter domain-containing protein [Mesorhizobium sp. VK9D]MDX8457005.1 autotransporter outer membrane beta-barrel domain-containing protein [Mesorhizobium sp. VK9D]